MPGRELRGVRRTAVDLAGLSRAGRRPCTRLPWHDRGVTTERAREAVSDVLVEEDVAAGRTRRPLDFTRLIVVSVTLIAVVALATAGRRTFSGLSADLDALGDQLPAALISLVAIGSAFIELLLLPALLFLLLLRRRFRSAAEVAVAIALGIGLSWLVTKLLIEFASDRVLAAFTPAGAATPGASPVPGSIAAMVAAFTVADVVIPGARTAAGLAIAGGVAAGLLDGATTVPGAALALGLGRVAGLLVRIVSGVPTRRPGGRQLVNILRKHGIEPLVIRGLPGGNPFRYDVSSTRGELTVSVLDRHRQGANLFGQVFRRIRIREELVPRQAFTFAGEVERRVLIANAATLAGVRTPRVVLAVSAEPDAAVIAVERVNGRPLATLRPHELSDAVADETWEQLRRMHAAGMAHHAMSGVSVEVDAQQRPWVVNPVGGEIAAPSFAMRADIAQLLVAVALVIGPERAVDCAVRVLGRSAVGDVVPLLQPVALPRRTRRAMRQQPDVLPAVRARVVERAEPQAVEPVPIVRFSARTLFTAIAAGFAIYLISSQLASVDLVGVLRQANWLWMLAALAASAVTYFGATFALLGFVAQPVPFWRGFAAQVALSFVRLVAPSAVGNTAVNIRLLTRAGVSAPAAAASVAASQLAALLVTVPLFLVLGLFTGRAATAGLAPSGPALIIVGLALIASVALIFLTPFRIRFRRLWQAFLDRGLPRLLDVLQSPVKLAQGVGGILVTTLAYTAALDWSIRALGGEASFAALALIFLTGNTLGTAIPTPGGLGAVEAALVAGLGAAGVPASVAVPGVLLFRIATFWLPLLPGWIAWTRLQRIGAL
jgi:glycosyltransferase 2 family protein